MKISIITVVWNNQAMIRSAINSILSQSYVNIEYIVIDGGSTDGTVEIIKSYGNKVSQFISEPDDGIYDAMNKGIALATGDVVGILNSDDFYADDKVIERVIQVFQQLNIDSVYADLDYVSAENTDKIVRAWRSKEYKKKLFEKGWHPAHPTFFVKRSVYEKYGTFNLKFKIAADYELMLRFLERYQVSSHYIPHTLIKMRTGGISNKNIFNIIKANMESYKSWRENGLPINPLKFAFKPVSKVFQFLSRDS